MDKCLIFELRRQHYLVICLDEFIFYFTRNLLKLTHLTHASVRVRNDISGRDCYIPWQLARVHIVALQWCQWSLGMNSWSKTMIIEILYSWFDPHYLQRSSQWIVIILSYHINDSHWHNIAVMSKSE